VNVGSDVARVDGGGGHVGGAVTRRWPGRTRRWGLPALGHVWLATAGASIGACLILGTHSKI